VITDKTFSTFSVSQCCQLISQNVCHINQKIRPIAKKFGPLENLFVEANISDFFNDSLCNVVRDKSTIRVESSNLAGLVKNKTTKKFSPFSVLFLTNQA
jgi:hypothetical protein